MREIKFRGMTRSGVWKYGCLMYSENIQPAIHWEVGKGEIKSWDWAFVISETVGQYTGLKDRKGNDIYEGDVVTWSNPNGKYSHGIVKWSGYEIMDSFIPCWVATRKGGGIALSSHRKGEGIEKSVEITGNIHEQ